MITSSNCSNEIEIKAKTLSALNEHQSFPSYKQQYILKRKKNVDRKGSLLNFYLLIFFNSFLFSFCIWIWFNSDCNQQFRWLHGEGRQLTKNEANLELIKSFTNFYLTLLTTNIKAVKETRVFLLVKLTYASKICICTLILSV